MGNLIFESYQTKKQIVVQNNIVETFYKIGRSKLHSRFPSNKLHYKIGRSKGGHRNIYCWEAGGTHPTGMLSCAVADLGLP